MREKRPAALLAALALAPAGCGGSGGGDTIELPRAALAVAVIGDTPYGAEEVAAFPDDLARIGSDREVAALIHLGDAQESASRCDDGYLRRFRRALDAFPRPVVYTPGDNEWTDCHLAAKGALPPLRRLASVRSILFDRPGRTLGRRRARVASQAAPFVENVRFERARIMFATLHVPGSNNGLAPWGGVPAPGAEQAGAAAARMRANLAWLDRAFALADARRARAVVIAMQADMWPLPLPAREVSGYRPIVARLARRARAFRRPVLVLQGDSHLYRSDRPLRRGSPLHDVGTAAPNVRRVVVQGGGSTPREWLRLAIHPRRKTVFTLERVPL